MLSLIDNTITVKWSLNYDCQQRKILRTSDGVLVIFKQTQTTFPTRHHIYYKKSTDGGTTWGSWLLVITDLSGAAACCFDVYLDSNDNILVTFSAFAGYWGIYYVKMTYNAGTQSWSIGTLYVIATNLYGSGQGVSTCSAIKDASGKVWVLLYQINTSTTIPIYTNTNDDGSGSWTKVSPTSSGNINGGALLPVGNNVWLIIQQGGKLTYRINNGTWQTETNIVASGITNDYIGTLKISDTNIFVGARTASGIKIFNYITSWDSGILISDNSNDAHIALGNVNGSAWVVWRDYDGTNYNISCRTNFSGSWTEQINIIDDATVDSYPGISNYDSINAFIYYISGSGSPYSLYFYSQHYAFYSETISAIDSLLAELQIPLDEETNITDLLEYFDVPSVINLSASQRTSDGKIEVNYDVYFNQFDSGDTEIDAILEYWDGNNWQSCITTTGEGTISITPGIWNTKQIIWTTKTDIDGTFIENSKIRIRIGYSSHYSDWESSNFNIDVKNPIIVLVSPLDETAQSLVRFPFTLDITEDSSYQMKIEISLLGGESFSSIIDSGWLNDAEIWNYYNDIRPLMYGTWYWRATAKDIYQNETESDIYEITLQDSLTNIRIDSIVKENTGSGIVKIYFSIKDSNYEKVSVRFDYTENDGETYHPCEITEVSSGNIEDNCFITNLLATTDWVQYWIKFKYSNDTEIQVVTDELKKKNLKVSSRVYINRDGTDNDISKIVSSVELSRNKQFGASQLTARCIDKEFLYNPNNTVSENNLVDDEYNPLIYMENVIKFSLKFLTDSGLKIYDKFMGYINNVELSKDSTGKNAISIISNDYIQKFINYMPENLEYKTTKQEVNNEILKTFDGITYYAEHGSWAEYPAPIAMINNEVLEYDKYIIDFVRGQIIYKGNTLSNLVTKTEICSNPSDDRKTWVMEIATDNSIKPNVYFQYQRYENFTCNDYTGSFNQWVDYIEELDELEDYYIDYENGVIYLYTALNTDETAEVIGNIKEQKIAIVYKEATTVTATYSYEIAGSNEVEDIIKDLATKSGISASNIQNTITDEDLILRDENHLYAKYNNLISLTLKRNGASLISGTDYDLDERNGIITLESTDVNAKNKIIEDCDYIWDEATADTSGEIVTQEIDTISKEEGTGSLKVIFPENGGYVLRDLQNDLYNVSITTQKYIEFYIKADKIGIVYLDVSYDNIHWESKTINITTSWNKIQWDVSSFTASYKDIKYLKLRGTDIIVWIDYIYIKRNLYTATYTYYTLQATGVTLSKVTMDYENTENAFQGIQDLLKNVAPNYLLYFDDNNKLVGYYSNQRLLRNCVNCWNNFNEGNRGYSRSYYGEHYRLNLPTNLVHNISDEDVYTGCIVIGKNTEPQNVALKGTITDESNWITGRGYSLSTTKNTNGAYEQAKKLLGKLRQNVIFTDMANQNSTTLNEGDIDALIDFDANTGYVWYKQNDAPDPNTLMCELVLEEAILWDRIDILIGAYDSKVIKEALYITVGDETGTNFWYTEKNKLKVEGGSSGSWITFENNFNQNVKIKYVRVYMSEPWQWTEVTTTSGGKGGGGSNSNTNYFYCFSLGEIEVWERATLIGKRTLDNVLIVGDGITDEVQIPNTPYKTKDYLEQRWGWIEKYPETITLYSDSFSNKLIDGVDYTYDKTTGLVSFINIPDTGDVICGTWTLDEKNPEDTTFYASFANTDLIRRLGIKYYKEVDDGLFTHEQTINRAGEILPELIRSIYPGTIDIIYRPDIKLGQSVLVINEELSLNRIFYIDSIKLNIEGFVPKCSLGITSYLELKDYEYQEENPSIYRDWKIHYPQFLTAFASYNENIPTESTPNLESIQRFYTGGICVEALDEDGNIKLDYNEECKIEIVSLTDSTTFTLLENTVKTEMWEDGIAELNFYIQWNQDGVGDRAKTPTELATENKWYIDKDIVFKIYETNNPTKTKQFSTKIRLYLAGTLKENYIKEAGSLGAIICYDNYSIVTVGASDIKEGKQFASDNDNIHSVLGNDDSNFEGFIINGQTIWRMMSVTGTIHKIQYYNWQDSEWQDWGENFDLSGYGQTGHGYLWGIFGGKILIGAYSSIEYGGGWYLFNGKVLSTKLLENTKNTPYIFNNQLYFIHRSDASGGGDPKTYTIIYNADGTLSGSYNQVLGCNSNAEISPFVLKNNLYFASAYVSNYGGGVGLAKQYIHKWNDITHQWEKLYQYLGTKAYPYIRAVYVYKNIAYLFCDTYGGGYWYPPFVGTFDDSDNQTYLKGYLTNKDWNILGTREIGSSKGIFTNFVLIKGSVYGISSSGIIKCLNPYFSSSKKQEIFKNES